MQITERDINLLRWINSHGVVTVQHVMRECDISEKNAYRRLRKLTNEGLIIHQRYFYNRPGIYSVSPMGTMVSEDFLPALRKLNNTTLRHDLIVTTVSQYLREKYQGKFTTERILRHRLGKKVVGNRNHIPDGHLQYDDKVVAIEVELTVKGSARLQTIFEQHLSNFEVDEVWYFCKRGSVLKKIKEYESCSSMVKVFCLNDFLEQESTAERYVA